jgi:hypothetical protein
VNLEKLIFASEPLTSVNDPLGTEYDQSLTIKFLGKERTDSRQIAARLQTRLAEHAYQLGIVQFWITDIRRSRQDLDNEIRIGRPPLDDLDGKILAIFHKSPFESAHSMAETLLVAWLTVLPHLHEFLRFKSLHLHWVPHLLTGDRQDKRKDYARAILLFLHAAKRDSWHHLVTADESCLF